MDRKASSVMQRLRGDSRVLTCIPLYYTTHDHEVKPTGRMPGSIIFDAVSLTRLMLPLVGPMRVMFETAGLRLRKEFAWLYASTDRGG